MHPRVSPVSTERHPTVPTPDNAPPAPPVGNDWRLANHWPELAMAVTDQSIETVDRLLRGLELMVQRGRLTEAEFRVLATPAQRMKQCGMHAQQIIRFQGGRVRQSHEKIDLAYLVETVLQEQRDELAMTGITLRRKFRPVQVLIDPTLGYALTRAMVAWGSPQGHHIDLRLDSVGDPARARLWMKIQTPEAPVQSQVFEDNIQWLLLRQIAATDGGIELDRRVEDDGIVLEAWFKRCLSQAAAASDAQASNLDPDAASTTFKTISGAYVLVCSAAADTRLAALGVVRKLGVTADGVASATQALAALRDREVHLLILDGVHPPADVASLQFDLATAHPTLAVLHLVAPGGTDPNAPANTQVAVDAIDNRLGSAVMFTLSNVL